MRPGAPGISAVVGPTFTWQNNPRVGSGMTRGFGTCGPIGAVGPGGVAMPVRPDPAERGMLGTGTSEAALRS